MSQDSNFYDVDPDASVRLAQGMNLGGGVELPFTAPVFWWLNGNPQARALAPSTPALYFGGWVVDAEKLAEIDSAPAPQGLVRTDLYTRNNRTIDTWTSRSLVIAPIGFRRCWMVGTDSGATRHMEYVQGARQHIQLLAMLGEKVQAGYHAWGPVVLSAKGFQVKEITGALKTWQKLLAPVLRKVAPAAPAWAFYLALGTFGNEPKTNMVGKTGAQSPITPIQLFQPKTIDETLLKTVFVGKETVTQMADYLDEAQVWLKAWEARAGGNGKTGHGTEPEFDDEYVPDTMPEEDVPF